jgi:D-alanyl-D-alanine carboxypeptidase/D-alanyl-D-alanine-endopeptidase (penicillin-binding protein 4)
VPDVRGRSAVCGVALLVVAVAPPAAAGPTPTPGPATVTTATELSPIFAAQGAEPTSTGLAARLAKLLTNSALGPHVGLEIVDAGTGTPLFSQGGDEGFTPASTTKLMTAAATLATLGPEARLHTRVVLEPSAPEPTPTPATVAPTPSAPPERTIVLVGGGDPLLTSVATGSDDLYPYPPRAHLDDLGIQTVQALHNAGIDRVRLRYDTSLFSGPAAAPEWAKSYTHDVVGSVVSLAVDAGRADPLQEGRVADPAARSAALFVNELTASGITVLDKPAPATATPGAPTIGDVASAPLSAMLEEMLENSDNDVAEAMARQVAIHDGRPGTFTDGAAAVRTEVSKLGVDLTGVTTYDGSGLSRQDRIPPRVLAQVIATAAGGPACESLPSGPCPAAPPGVAPNPALRVLVAGLAAAGVNGTLGPHFVDSQSRAARGILRAKSGSLQGVVSLAGILPDADGRLLTFDAVADQVAPGFGLAARVAIERIAAALLTCGCR